MKKFLTTLLIFSILLVFASLSFVAADYGRYNQVNYDYGSDNYNTDTNTYDNTRYNSYSDCGMKSYYSSYSSYTPCRSCQIVKPLIIYDRTPEVRYIQQNVQKCVTCVPQRNYYSGYSGFSYTY